MDIEAVTKRVITAFNILKKSALVSTQEDFLSPIGIPKSSVSMIFADPTNKNKRYFPRKKISHLCEYWKINEDWLVRGTGKKFTDYENIIDPDNKDPENQKGVPMFDVAGTASNVEVYDDINQEKPVGVMYFPGAEDCDLALPVWGHSMYPFLQNGDWAALKKIDTPYKISYGEVYFLEWGNHRMYKRLLKAENEIDDVVAYSDNTSEIVYGGRLKYAEFTIKRDEIRKLYLVKDMYRRNSH